MDVDDELTPENLIDTMLSSLTIWTSITILISRIMKTWEEEERTRQGKPRR